MDDRGIAELSLGLSCAAAAANPGLYQFELAIDTCDSAGGTCPKRKTVNLDFLAATGFCPELPAEEDCDDDTSCNACKSTGGGLGGGEASAAGGGGMAGGEGTGPGARLRYKAGGAGMIGHPGAAAWRTELGMFWSHDYAQRLFVDPAPAPFVSRVFQVTRSATYATWGDATGDGVYESRRPASGYQRLEGVPGGWELRKLDGTLTAFDTGGRWLSETDRFGNAKTATYDAGKLVAVDFPDQRREEFTYHASGKLATITEVGIDGTSSRTWSYTWTGENLTRIDLPDGRALVYLYEDLGHPGYLTQTRLVGTDLSERITAAFDYDPSGNVVRLWRGATTFAAGVDRWEFDFDNPNLPRVVAVTDPLNDVATYTFDNVRTARNAKAKVVRLDGECPSCGTGPNSQLVYGDPANLFRPTQITNGRGVVTRMSYDANGRLLERIEAFGTPLERATTFEWDPVYPALLAAAEQPSTTGNVAELRRRELAYNGEGALTVEHASGVEAGAPFLLTTAYAPTAEGQTASVNRPGYGTADVVSLTFDPARGNLLPLTRTDPLVGTTTFGYDAFNRRTSVTDPNGVVTETTYDEMNRVLTVTQKGATPAGDLVTEHVFNPLGDLFQTIHPRGNTVEYLYDAAGRPISMERKPDNLPASHGDRQLWTLNAAGQRTREDRQRWTGVAWSATATRTDWTYTSRCHLDKTILGIAAGELATTEYAYDCAGNLESVWDANHPRGSHPTPTTSYQYDALDRLVLTRQPFGGAGAGNVDTTYSYDLQDHLAEVVDANGTVTSYVTSDRDLVTMEVSEVSGTTLSNFDEHGNLATRLDARGVLTLFAHDPVDRPTLVDHPETADIAYTWDDPLVPFSKGRLTRIAQGSQVVDYRYDRFGRTTQDGELTYTLDANGNRTEIVYPGGMEANATFDFADRPATLSATPAGGSASNIVTAVTYRPFGPISSLTLGNTKVETRDFDGRDFPDRIRVSTGLLDWNYTVDKVGNPITIDDPVPANDRTFGYQDYQYFLAAGNGPWGARGWTYDKIGNRLTETRGATTDTYAYTLNAASGASPKLATITSTAGNKSFTFDAAGNETQVGTTAGPVDRTYDDAGRLIRQSFGTAAADFRYDGRGFLASITNPEAVPPGTGIFCADFETGNTTQWGGPGIACLQEGEPTLATYSTEGLLHSVTTPAEHRQVLYFGSRPIALLRETAARSPNTLLSLHFLTTDHLGTPILATTQAGTTHWVGGFEPFGADWNAAQSAGLFLRLPGQWVDETWTGAGGPSTQAYNLFRWVAASSGRYITVDPAGLVASRFAPYLNVANNPLRFVDPSGLMTCILVSAQRVAGWGDYDLLFSDHTAIFISQCGSTSEDSCQSGGPRLYDPAGGYVLGYDGAGSSDMLTAEIPNWSLGGFVDYHCSGGSSQVEGFCFPTTCCEERDIAEKAPSGVPGGQCSIGVSSALNGVGPFKDLGSGLTPKLLRLKINRLLQLYSGGGAFHWTRSCKRTK